ncbi:hypothetical protein AX768_02490 [Burkholderia sp. PAMC 28687]|uniref:FliM/FliN family flagellar motor C-terminal domain-containing protein n=1 Tax=Burkholderia sp. PAMC 28687 TaxID=1795874 RepID=UPI000780A42A|nr:FliM/FliN family flagellar motor C-terminal domain-containing protein [Burkholderia sp. PAMC 28687]AMM13146.1 hypothetical protein AX768_02490 [Burkholderia sp. PAMC 28687]
MSVTAIRWRPLGERDLDACRDQVMKAIEGWQTQWFANAFLRIKSVELLTSGTHEFALPAASVAWSCGVDAWLSVSRRALSTMVNRALDLPKTFSPDTEVASSLLSDVERQLVDSLFTTVRGAFELDGTFVPIPASNVGKPLRIPHGAAHVRLATADDAAALSIVVGAQTLWRCFPVAASPEFAVRTESESRTAALDGIRVPVAATLGQCELTVPQLATLSIGDVITLDYQTRDAVPLVLAHSRATVFATGRPGQSAGKFSIQLASIARPHIS